MSLVPPQQASEGCQARYEEVLHSWADKIRLKRSRLLRASIGEFLGTLVLVYFGTGAVVQYRLSNDHGAISINLGWGMGVLFSIFISGTMGYGLNNPAATLAFALIGRIPWIAVPVLSLVQYAGGFVGALVVHFVYRENILGEHDPELTITSGKHFVAEQEDDKILLFTDRIIGTAILTAVCVAIGDRNNFQIPRFLSPLFVALVVHTPLGAHGVSAGAAQNPARDFGSRLALLALGYERVFLWSRGYFWVPLLRPYIGALIGAIGYELFIGIHLR